jgi:hypothetical protein
MDKVQNSVILSVIGHRQNLLCSYTFVITMKSKAVSIQKGFYYRLHPHLDIMRLAVSVVCDKYISLYDCSDMKEL